MTRSTLIVLYLYARKADKKEDKGGGGNNGEDVVTSLERVAFNVTPSFLSFPSLRRNFYYLPENFQVCISRKCVGNTSIIRIAPIICRYPFCLPADRNDRVKQPRNNRVFAFSIHGRKYIEPRRGEGVTDGASAVGNVLRLHLYQPESKRSRVPQICTSGACMQ